MEGRVSVPEYPIGRVAQECVARFFIKDLLKAQKCNDVKIFRGRFLFKLKGVVFDTVAITGTITGIDNTFPRGIYVDDGTATIRCLFEQQNVLEDLERDVKFMQGDIEKNFEDNSYDNNMRRYEVKRMPRTENLRRGDKIQVVGRLYAFEDRFTIYIDKYEVSDENIQDEILYYKEMLELYGFYEKKY